MRGKVVIVTGASAGVGRAYALALAGAGATVVAAARTLGANGEAAPGTLLEVVHAAAGLPGVVHAQRCDVEREDDVVALVERTIADFGAVHAVVNNAAIVSRLSLLGVSCEEWDQIMRVNVRAPYLTARHVVPHMREQGGGSIVNITSGSADFVPKGSMASDPNLLAYAVSKAALNRLTYFLAEELREHKIAVNAMSPGYVKTRDEDGPTAKPATPEVVGPPLLHLVQQTPDTMTGQILHADRFEEWARPG